MDYVGKDVMWRSRGTKYKSGRVVGIVPAGSSVIEAINSLHLPHGQSRWYSNKPTKYDRYLIVGSEATDKATGYKRKSTPSYYSVSIHQPVYLATENGEEDRTEFPCCPVCGESICGVVPNKPDLCECYTCGNKFERR